MRSRLAALLSAALALTAGAVVAAPTASATAPTVAPTMHAAQFDPSSPNPVLSWDVVAGAAKYQVQISDSTNFSAPIYQVDTVGLQVTPPTNLPLTTLYWRVAAEDSLGHAGPYSGDSQFKTRGVERPRPYR